MKRKILFLSLLAICIAIAAAGTLAYFTAEGRAQNVITTGSIKIEVVEQQKSDDGTLTKYPSDPINNVMPGMEISKIVTIENTGKNEAWIRVSVEKLIELNKENPAANGVAADTELIELKLSDSWVEKDGYYYYKNPVKAGESTAPLFSSVKFAESMGNAYQGCTAYINIYAQAVQTANNPAADGDVTNVAGWPEKGE